MSHSRPLTISIIIPAYNRAATIRGAIESVLRQTYTDFELLIVDDGSTDDTMARVTEISDPRIRLLANPENMGASAARNTGIKNARGKWVAFQDSDDEWLPEKLQKQMHRIESKANDPVACYCGMVVVGRHDQGEQERPKVHYIPDAKLTKVEGDILPTVLMANPASTQTLMVRREVLNEIGGFDENLPALVDWDCVMRLANRGPFAFVDEPLVLQYFSENSITRSRANRAIGRLKIIEKNAALWKDHPEYLAQHYRSVAGDRRRLGDIKAARKAIASARRLCPTSVKLWAVEAYLLLQSLLNRRRNAG